MMEGKESAKTDVSKAFNMKKECPVCLSEFLPADSRLKLLTCTHEICVGCVKKIDKCPICKETLTVVDFENAEFVFRRGFNCHTCETRRTSEKMRICVTCSEANGILVKPDKLKQCSAFIFCSECVIDDHMEQGHRQEKLMNYDLDHVSIKDMQRTCLTMRPLLERISSGMEDRARNYWKMTEAIKLVLSPDVDLHFSQLHSVCSFFREFLDTLSGDSDFQRKYATIWKELSNVLDEETSKKIAGEGEELFMKQRDFKEKIRLQQEEINELQSHLKERTEREKELRQEFEAKFLSQREDIGKLQADLSTEKQLTQQTETTMFLKIGFGKLFNVAQDYTDIVEITNEKMQTDSTALLFAGKNGGEIVHEKKHTSVNFHMNDIVVKHEFHTFFTAKSKRNRRHDLEEHVYCAIYNSLLTVRQKKEKQLSMIISEYGREVIPSPLDVGILCLQGMMKSLYQLNQIPKHFVCCLNMDALDRMEVVQHLLMLCADQVGLTVFNGEVQIRTPNDIRLLHDALHASGLSKKRTLKERSVHRGLTEFLKEKTIVENYPIASSTIAKFQKSDRSDNNSDNEMDTEDCDEIFQEHKLKLMTHPSSVISELDEEEIRDVTTLGTLLDVRTVFSTIVKKAKVLDLCQNFLIIDPSVLLEYETTGMSSIDDTTLEEFRQSGGDVLLPYLHQNPRPELNHFILFRANFGENKLFVYDSIFKHNSEMVSEMIRRFLHADDLVIEKVRVPQQQRDFMGNTCGFHVMKNTMHILQGLQIPHKHDIDYFRRDVMRTWNIPGEPFNPNRRIPMFSTGKTMTSMDTSEIPTTSSEKAIDQNWADEKMDTTVQPEIKRKSFKKEIEDDSITIQVNGSPHICATKEFVPEGYNEKTQCNCCVSQKFITESKGGCCKFGKAVMKEPTMPPNLMYDLYAGVHPKSPHFEKNVLLYNTLLSFASLERHRIELDPHGPQPAKEKGPLYTHISQLYGKVQPQFANCYTLESSQATKARYEWAVKMTKKKGCVDETLLSELGDFFAKHNCFAILYHNFHEVSQKMEEKKIKPQQVYMRLLDRYDVRKTMTSTNAGCFNVPTTGDTVSVIYDGRTDEALKLSDYRSWPKFTKQQLKRIKIKGQLPKSVNVYQYTRDTDAGIPRMPIRHWAPMSEPMAYALITPYGDYLFRGASMEQHPVGTHVESLLKDDPYSIAHIKVDKNGYPINYPPDDRRQQEKTKKEIKKDITEKEEKGNKEEEEEEPDSESIHEVNVRDMIQTTSDDSRMQVNRFEDINGEEIPIPHKRTEEADEEMMDIDSSPEESENEESDHDDPNFSNSSSDDEMLADVKSRLTKSPATMKMETEEEIERKTEEELRKLFEIEQAEFMKGNPQARHVSRRQYAAYALQTRPWNKLLNYHPLISTGKLGQLYIIDQFMRILDDMTSYSAKKRVQKLRANKNRLFTYLAKMAIRRKVTIGTVTTLPFNFPESPRWYKTLFENAIAIMNKVGPPDLFLTMTANPDQPEIRDNMIGAPKRWENNSALVCKSFHARMEELFNDILGKKDSASKRPMKGIFGRVSAFVYSTEFQARGLPHIHMLITLHPDDKLDTPEKVNKVIKAEVPEVTDDMTPEEKERVLDLREKVLKRMQHTVCQINPNAKCLKNKKEHWKTCQKRFPKDFAEETSINEDGYAKLMRRSTNELNRWIVPYNPYLLQKHNCHINVESCASVHSIKYIFKYIYKGVDKVLMEVTDALHNENRSKTKKLTVVDHLILPKEVLTKLSPGAKSRLNDNAIRTLTSQGVPLSIEGNKVVAYDEGAILKECRVITAMEAAWKLLSLPMHGESHVVDTLFVHEENQEDIVFDDEDDPEEIKKLADEHVTRLMAYFKAMKEHQRNGQPVITYLDLPRFFRFEKKEWKPRVYHKEERHIGYIKPVQPRFQQLFALRELSRVVPATGFEDYLHHDGKRYDNFLEAARARKLINGEDEWELAMKEVVQKELPSTIRMMFAQILIFGNPKRPKHLYDMFKGEMFNHNMRNLPYAEPHCLHHIRSYLRLHGRTLEDFSLPPVNEQMLKESRNYGAIEDESEDFTIDIDDEKRLAEEMREQMNEDQLAAADEIWKIILHPENHRNRCLFLTGSGGTGKTFVYNYLYHRVNATEFNDQYGDRVEMTAHTGVAATLLKNGSTVHSRYGLPLNMDHNSHSSIDVDRETKRAKQLRNLRVVFWDESTMSSCWMFQVIDELLRKIRGIDKPFGGVVMVCGGDWKQLLPVSLKGGPVDASNLSLKKSNFWKLFKTITLHKNIRAKADPGFTEFIENVGRGTNEVSEGRSYQVEIPKSMVCENLNKMIFDLFGGNKLNDPYSIRHSALLTVLNKDSLELNKKILRQLHTFEKTYLSMDMPVEQRSLTVLAPETFHSLTPSGMPPHELTLKKNCIVILLKNLSVSQGLCNGTKLIVKDLGENVIHCETLPEGTDAGHRVPIFRIPLKSAERMGEFQFQRTQFPLRLGYSMTINKSQGQTLDKVGIVLTNPVFAHGHLYVALSRARNRNDVKIYTGKPLEEDETAVVSNVVLRDMIDD